MVLQTTGAQSRAFTFEGQKLTILSDTYGGTTDNIMYTYDPKSFLPLSERQGVGVGTVRGTVDYTWGTSTDLMASYKITDPEVPPNDTQTITYGYFADNSVASIHWSRGPGSYRYTYDGNGQPITISFPNGQTRNFTYDDQGRLTKIRNLLGTTNLATFDYEYDKDNDTGLFTVLGQRTKVTANVPALSPIATKTESFYDASSQLTRTRTTTTSATEQSWTYDAIGNRLTQTAGGTTTTYSYVKNGTNPNNSARLATAGANTLSHDVNGNVTAFGAITYAWDVLDRLKTRTGGGLTSTFSYDAQGRRTGIDHESEKFIYQGLNAVDMSYQKAGGYYRSNYLFGPGIDEPLARVDSTEVTYYSVDGLGSVSLLTDGAGAAKNKYSYGSWGERQTASESLVQPFLYTSRESLLLDEPVFENLYYYRARYMMPGIGRFISEDPLQQYVQVIGGDVYNYVGNSPMLFDDPFGLDRCRTQVFHGEPDMYRSRVWRTAWELGRSGTMPGARGISNPNLPIGIGSPFNVNECIWSQLLMITKYWRRRVTTVIRCDCPPSVTRSNTFETWQNESVLRRRSVLTQSNTFLFLTVPCPRPEVVGYRGAGEGE
jgi:RHS repeat-associated protein